MDCTTLADGLPAYGGEWFEKIVIFYNSRDPLGYDATARRVASEHSVYGSRRLTALLQREGQEVNRKRVVRLLQLMGVEAVYPKRSFSQPAEGIGFIPTSN